MSIPPSSATVRSTISRQYASSLTSPGSDRPLRPASSTGRTGRVGVLLLVREVRDRDVGALAGERERDGAADAGVPAGDQGAAALQAPAAAVALLAVVRRRSHVGLVTRVVELQLWLLGLGVLGRRVLRGGLVVGHGDGSAQVRAVAPTAVARVTAGAHRVSGRHVRQRRDRVDGPAARDPVV
jgi:hypothetical protein